MYWFDITRASRDEVSDIFSPEDITFDFAPLYEEETLLNSINSGASAGAWEAPNRIWYKDEKGNHRMMQSWAKKADGFYDDFSRDEDEFWDEFSPKEIPRSRFWVDQGLYDFDATHEFIDPSDAPDIFDEFSETPRDGDTYYTDDGETGHFGTGYTGVLQPIPSAHKGRIPGHAFNIAWEMKSDKGKVWYYDTSTGQYSRVLTAAERNIYDNNDYIDVDHQTILDQNRGEDLQGLPGQVNVPGYGYLGFGSHGELQNLANDYMSNTEYGYVPPRDYVKVNPDTASQIATEYDQLPHAPDDPAVQESYNAFINETLEQYNHLVESGYTFEFYPDYDPYPNSPREAVMDLHNNKHMYVYPTEAGFGSGDEEYPNHPLMGDSGIVWNQELADGSVVQKPVYYNDIFRAVHDVYGHAKEGVGFRADGEDNAYRQHSAMYSPLARGAMAAETRGQNSWVNYGPYGETNRSATTSETVFAPQKATILPEWAQDPNLHANQTYAYFKKSVNVDDLFGDDVPDEEVKQYEDRVIKNLNKDWRSEIYRIIMEAGGIKTHEDDIREEYRRIPNTYKRRDGLSGDEMAEYLATYFPQYGIKNEVDLINILSEYSWKGAIGEDEFFGMMGAKFQEGDIVTFVDHPSLAGEIGRVDKVSTRTGQKFIYFVTVLGEETEGERGDILNWWGETPKPFWEEQLILADDSYNIDSTDEFDVNEWDMRFKESAQKARVVNHPRFWAWNGKTGYIVDYTDTPSEYDSSFEDDGNFYFVLMGTINGPYNDYHVLAPENVELIGGDDIGGEGLLNPTDWWLSEDNPENNWRVLPQRSEEEKAMDPDTLNELWKNSWWKDAQISPGSSIVIDPSIEPAAETGWGDMFGRTGTVIQVGDGNSRMRENQALIQFDDGDRPGWVPIKFLREVLTDPNDDLENLWKNSMDMSYEEYQRRMDEMLAEEANLHEKILNYEEVQQSPDPWASQKFVIDLSNGKGYFWVSYNVEHSDVLNAIGVEDGNVGSDPQAGALAVAGYIYPSTKTVEIYGDEEADSNENFQKVFNFFNVDDWNFEWNDEPIDPYKWGLPKQAIEYKQEVGAPSSATTQDFFSDVMQSEHAPQQPLKPEHLSQDPYHQELYQEMQNYYGPFDEHIETSIPDFRNNSLIKIQSLLNMGGGTFLDIAGSTGALGKTLTSMSNGAWTTNNLEPNQEMINHFNSTPIPGAEITDEAFGGSFEDNGRVVPYHQPQTGYDVVHESMGFQFIGPDREGQVQEVKSLLNPGGLFLTEEKFHTDNEIENERIKDEEFKSHYYDTEQLERKNQEVGFQNQGPMTDNLVHHLDYERILQNNFSYVQKYWESGNFMGYAASDNPDMVEGFISGMSRMASVDPTVDDYFKEAIDTKPMVDPFERDVKKERGALPFSEEDWGLMKQPDPMKFKDPTVGDITVTPQYLQENGLTTEVMAQNILEVLSHAHPEDLEEGTAWYDRIGQKCEEWSKQLPYSKEQLAAVFAVCSPRTNWDENESVAEKIIWGHYNGTITHEADVEVMYSDEYVNGQRKGLQGLPRDRRKAFRILQNNDLSELGNGEKVNNFFQNFMGNTDLVTADVWATRIAIGQPNTNPQPAGAAYGMISDAYRLAAQQAGMTPRDLQAAIWVYYRRMGGSLPSEDAGEEIPLFASRDPYFKDAINEQEFKEMWGETNYSFQPGDKVRIVNKDPNWLAAHQIEEGAVGTVMRAVEDAEDFYAVDFGNDSFGTPSPAYLKGFEMEHSTDQDPLEKLYRESWFNLAEVSDLEGDSADERQMVDWIYEDPEPSFTVETPEEAYEWGVENAHTNIPSHPEMDDFPSQEIHDAYWEGFLEGNENIEQEEATELSDEWYDFQNELEEEEDDFGDLDEYINEDYFTEHPDFEGLDQISQGHPVGSTVVYDDDELVFEGIIRGEQGVVEDEREGSNLVRFDNGMTRWVDSVSLQEIQEADDRENEIDELNRLFRESYLKVSQEMDMGTQLPIAPTGYGEGRIYEINMELLDLMTQYSQELMTPGGGNVEIRAEFAQRIKALEDERKRLQSTSLTYDEEMVPAQAPTYQSPYDQPQPTYQQPQPAMASLMKTAIQNAMQIKKEALWWNIG